MRACPPVCPVNTGEKQEVILFSDLRLHKSHWQAIRVTALFVEPWETVRGQQKHFILYRAKLSWHDNFRFSKWCYVNALTLLWQQNVNQLGLLYNKSTAKVKEKDSKVTMLYPHLWICLLQNLLKAQLGGQICGMGQGTVGFACAAWESCNEKTAAPLMDVITASWWIM